MKRKGLVQNWTGTKQSEKIRPKPGKIDCTEAVRMLLAAVRVITKAIRKIIEAVRLFVEAVRVLVEAVRVIVEG